MCKQCELKPVYEFTNKRKLCGRCFIRWFEKKILFSIRKFNMIKKGDVVGYFESEHFRSVVLESVLNMTRKKGYLKIKKIPRIKDTLKETVRRFGVNKLAWPITIDITSENIIDEIINWDFENSDDFLPVEKLGKNSKIIKPIYLFLDKEVLLYAKLKKLKFRRIRTKGTKISNFIDELEEKHPEVKRAIVKSYLALRQS